LVVETDVTIFVAIFAGVASFISPCVLPLLPGYLSLMSGYSVAELSEGDVSLRRVAGRTGLFVAGFTAVFVALGAGATSIGRFLLEERGSLQTVAGWVVIFFGLFIAYTAIWTPQFLMPFMKDRRVDVNPGRLGGFAPPVMGAAFAFGWTPCLGPFLGATLTLGANSDTVVEGMVMLFFYSLGLGIPFLIASVLLAKAFARLDRLKRYFTPISVMSGLLLAAFGVLLVTNQLTALNAWFSDILIRIGLDNLTEI
jgi:cytochrome c-type biogenesis protein